MIKRLENDDIDIVMDIWLNTNIKVHNFIPQEYWLSNFILVKEKYFPNADTLVYEDEEAIKAFISVMNGYYIGALFVSEEFQSQGLGSQLIDYCKEKYPRLELTVYKANASAVNFYKKCDFIILSEHLNEDSLYPEYIMEWKR